jgi:hypothetical protein
MLITTWVKYFKWNQILLLKIWHVPNVIKCIH